LTGFFAGFFFLTGFFWVGFFLAGFFLLGFFLPVPVLDRVFLRVFFLDVAFFFVNFFFVLFLLEPVVRLRTFFLAGMNLPPVLAGWGPLARIMHKLSTAVPPSSTLTALCFLGLLGVLHQYACGALRCTPCHRGACSTSSRKPMHNPG